jgi:DnaJ-class molecular chaperone
MKEFYKKFYEKLEVAENATPEQIKQAYRKLSMMYHPDKNDNPLAREKWEAINEAYEVLMDVERRREYDSRLKQDFQNRTEPQSIANRQPSSDGTVGAMIAVGLGAFLIGLMISDSK